MEEMKEKLITYLEGRIELCFVWAEEAKWNNYSHTKGQIMGALDFCLDIGIITTDEWSELFEYYM